MIGGLHALIHFIIQGLQLNPSKYAFSFSTAPLHGKTIILILSQTAKKGEKI